MSKIQKALFVSIGFLLLWIGWCFLVIHFGVPKVLQLMNLNTHILAYALIGLPFVAYAGGLIAWYVNSTKK